MIRINQLKMPLGHTMEELQSQAAKKAGLKPEALSQVRIRKQSIDARKKPDIFYSYVVDIELRESGGQREEKLVRRLKDRNISVHREVPYRLPKPGPGVLSHPPVIVGTGPAGLFCGLILARKGYRPLLLERGEDVDARTARVDRFWKEGELCPSSNVQFGEGGAGTFSDGKLNTLVKDASGRNHEVLRIFTEFGADPSICYVNKPHIGTDVLSCIVKAMRREIESLGGQVRFLSQVTDVTIEEGRLTSLTVNDREVIRTEAAVFAIGHSARDTFGQLWARGIPMEPKPFAVGLRIQHPQSLINRSQYGKEEVKELGPASYKLTRQTSSGRGVYSFCMCPGGYVVNASSEPGRLAVNGMSYHDRAGENANSALIVTVTPEDFASYGTGPLAGVAFQRDLEEKAYQAGNGRIPVQLYGDFKENRVSEAFGGVTPAFRGQYAFANLRRVLPEALSQSLLEAMEGFGSIIEGFDRPDAVFAGVESRTSSPVRIPRDSHMESEIKGLFPCGEGAGYAGGITSAAMDGIKAAEELISRYQPFASEERHAF
ncbi:NAD(P)/FAD-dependent oxidoreductase [Lacrimispora sp. 210928-DFI.3.58]|uniref:NAD(P)/FAD-dependent oxidoreductase n=1 Tax=Lacrimispora sp. 210928-DFI.3.58 TaxID=2883214 RepID=UPI0015B5CF76|nr:NAD(P)-binding protein [Lacrimispora sp. 210928-DFI.3.58]MCB7317828.1 NAD(P)-binding protein [Lacrimispora sp. 210928-DFI.3.58]